MLTKTVRELLQEGDYYRAGKIRLEYDEWVDRKTTLRELADALDRVEARGEGRVSAVGAAGGEYPELVTGEVEERAATDGDDGLPAVEVE